MSRPRAPREGKRAATESPAPATRAQPRPLAGLLVLLALAVAAVFAWRFAFPPGANEGGVPAGLGAQQLEDSLKASVLARDWEPALKWARAANASAHPTAAGLLNEGMAWHNYAEGGSHRWPGRSAMRTSLDRIDLEKRAWALFDSAQAVAGTEYYRAQVEHWRGVQFDVLGLPIDALGAYEAAYARTPEDQAMHARLVWMIHLIVRPTDPRSVTPKDVEPRR